ncbi:uncharacterized protein [Eurosta solidaginis]|uniref:uncharacterized protein n=1 Tax=Eurosta solidaginis TaxID=178769 RepID=UPI0035312BDE
MKSLPVLFFLTFAFCVANVHADCNDDNSKSSDEGEVTHFFKNLGCKIQKGAENLQENAKPWTEKLGASAKEFGSSVAQKYDELKHKLTDENKDAGPSTPFPIANAPTEKVPLAPLFGETVAAQTNNNNPSLVAAAGKDA